MIKTAKIEGLELEINVDLKALESRFGRGNVYWWRIADSVAARFLEKHLECFTFSSVESPEWKLYVILKSRIKAVPDPRSLVDTLAWSQVEKIVWAKSRCFAYPLLAEVLKDSGAQYIECENCGTYNNCLGVFCSHCAFRLKSDVEDHEESEDYEESFEYDEEKVFEDVSVSGLRANITDDSNVLSSKAGVIEESASSLLLHDIPFVKVNPGTFLMGCEKEEPIHKVTISRAFYISSCLITQKQFELVMNYNPSIYKGENHPTNFVSWYEAQIFCNKLSAILNKPVRLPTEAEWEYACRAGVTTKYYWGDIYSSDYAWINKAPDTGPCPVGTLKPNQWGLYDMLGNVWEWCSDWYGSYSEKDQVDPQGAFKSKLKILRGGSWIIKDFFCSTSYRNYNSPQKKHEHNGFRCVISI